MKKRVASITLVLALLIGAGAATYALADDRGRRGHGMHGGGRYGHGIMRMLRALDLSDEQRDEVGNTLLNARKTSIVVRAQLRVARMELHQALLQDEVDSAAVAKLANQIKTLQSELLDIRIQVQQAINNILTPEQRGKARTMFLERMGGRSEGRFHHGRGYYGRGYERFHGDGEDRPRGPGRRN